MVSGAPAQKGHRRNSSTRSSSPSAAIPGPAAPRIAQEIARTFGIDIDKDVVRRVLAKHYRPRAGDDGPSWLSFIGHLKDSLWSVDLFRCESILLRSHWVMVVNVSHPFVERLIGTIRWEFLDHVLIWNAVDLGRKLEEFRTYNDENRVHQSLGGSTPGERSGQPPPSPAILARYAWRHHCGGLFQMPIAA